MDASNATLYCSIRLECPEPEPTLTAHAVYKPIRGERPLDDFPRGTLAYREVAAYELSEAGGWRVVPPTVLREGPFGPGMVQLWIETTDDENVFELVLTGDPRLRPMALFDAVANNADRKGGHLLPLEDGRILGVDHGICFAVEPKLRTILWAWRGDPLTEEEVGQLETVREMLRGELGARLADLLAPREVTATIRRVERLLARRRMPLPDLDRPAIPWPPF